MPRVFNSRSPNGLQPLIAPGETRGGMCSSHKTPKGLPIIDMKFVYFYCMSYRQILYQIVFATKNREKTITEAHCEDLYKYIWGTIKNRKCKLFRINGTEDHIHIFSDLHPSISLADYVKEIKVASSSWMKDSGKFPLFNGWQEGYGAFTYSVKEKDNVIAYIKNQKEHHKTEGFYDEYKRLLKEHEIEFDEKYLL